MNKQEENVKKDWNAPEIIDLDVDNTESATNKATAENPPFWYIAS